jgi:adenylate kinase
MVPSAVLIFGPPGSGKSTQANLLADTLAYEVVDTGRLLGNILHDPARQDDPEIRAEREKYDTGELVSDAFFEKAMQAHITDLESRKISCVFGGAPRTLGQARSFIPRLLEVYGAEHVHAFLVDLSLEECRKRMDSRATCTVCGRPQLAMGPASGIPDRCRSCGGALYVRSDKDDADTRFKAYQEQTVPVLAYLEENGIAVRRVDGSRSPEEVHEDIFAALKD